MSAQFSWLKQLIQPADSVTDIADRQRATLFAALMLMIGLFLIAMFIWIIIINQMTSDLTLLLIISGAVIWSCFALSRTRYYRIGTLIYMLWAYAAIVVGDAVVSFNHPDESYIYLAAWVMTGGLIFTIPETIFLLIVALVTLLVQPTLQPAEPVSSNTAFIVIIIGMFTIVWVWVSETYRQRVHESEQRARDLMNANNEGLLIVAAEDASILDMNTAFTRIMGYEREDAIGRYPADFLKSPKRETAIDMWRNKDTQQTVEFLGERKDGSSVYIEATLKPYKFQEQQSYVIVVQDITERKATEDAFVASERQFQAIFDNTFQFLGLLEVDGRIKEMNRSALEFSHLTHDDLVGKHLWSMSWWQHSPEQRQMVKAKVLEAASGAFVRFETELHHGKQVLILDFSITPVRDESGAVTLLIPEGRDITEMKHQEQMRVEYERRYEALFKHTADAVYIIGLDGKPLDANQQGLTILRCTMEDIVGGSFTMYVADTDHSDSLNVMQNLLEGKPVPPVYERQMRRKDGTEFVAEISAQMVHDVDGKPLYVQSMVRDTTERRKAERDRFNLELERERTQLLEHFISQASHHFRTPMTNIKTSIYLLPRLAEHPDRQQQHFGIIRKELERLESLLSDLIMVTRLKKDDTSYKLARIELNNLLSEVQASLQNRTRYAEFQWQWHPDAPEHTIIIGDKTHLARTVMNIIDNAMSYSDAGKEITVRGFTFGRHWAVVEVQDNGIGISDADLLHIFDNFYRAETARERESSSSGLGLPIAKQVVDRHRGDIRVDSTLGQGTTVQIILPVTLDWNTTPPPLPSGMLQALGDNTE